MVENVWLSHGRKALYHGKAAPNGGFLPWEKSCLSHLTFFRGIPRRSGHEPNPENQRATTQNGLSRESAQRIPCFGKSAFLLGISAFFS